MYGFWQDQINGELRTLRRVEARERLDVEDQLLRAGHHDQVAAAFRHRPGRWLPFFQLAIRGIPAGARRTRHAPQS